MQTDNRAFSRNRGKKVHRVYTKAAGHLPPYQELLGAGVTLVPTLMWKFTVLPLTDVTDTTTGTVDPSLAVSVHVIDCPTVPCRLPGHVTDFGDWPTLAVS